MRTGGRLHQKLTEWIDQQLETQQSNTTTIKNCEHGAKWSVENLVGIQFKKYRIRTT